jgi:translation initiation factor IF-2
MNITELARRLKVNTVELTEKLPELGFDIGRKAIKVDDMLASRIIKAWWDFKDRERQKTQYFQTMEKKREELAQTGTKIEIPPVLTVKDFATLVNLPVTKVIAELMKSGVMASMNQRIDYDTAAIVASDFGYEPIQVTPEHQGDVNQDKLVKATMEGEAADMVNRPPIVVVMGHVDHGKTKTLDAIRKTNVMEGEAGGITQHIGAYQVEKKGRKITFIDTPGHEAFTAMRSRGAKVADIAILVVAANDSIMPQTVEAIKIAQAAEIPIIVAINKIDLPDANPDKVKQDMTKYNLLTEEWGGNTICVPISAKQGTNIDTLLENVLLVADMNQEKIKANPNGDFLGAIIESHVDPGEGPVATVLVKNGTLKIGDYVAMSGVLYGKIRMMKDALNQNLTEVLPSEPAKILGLKVAPKVGDILERISDPKKAKKAKTYAMQKQDETFIKQHAEAENDAVTKLPIILRADVLGSQEAIIESLKKIENENIKIDIVSKGLGNITESDVSSAEATGALLMGFSVLAPPQVQRFADEKKVQIKIFKIIYEVITEVKNKLNEIVKPEVIREDLGKLEVLGIFKKTNDYLIIGGRVTTGKIEPNSKVAVFRKGEFVTSGKVTELQVGRQSVTDAVRGQECGMKFIGQPIVAVGDMLDIYKEREFRRIV